MCFNFSLNKQKEYIEERFQVKFKELEILFSPFYYRNAFARPMLPVVADSEDDRINYFRWGLIPSWVKDEPYADKISASTINARAETIFEKPSFKSQIRKKRCLVLADGFVEWQDNRGEKLPYYIKLKNDEAFAFAGIYDSWTNPLNDKEIKTFSIITTTANPLMEKIHNVKKRMPVILNKEDERKWLTKNFTDKEISSMLLPFDENEMNAYRIDKALFKKGGNPDSEKLREEFKED